MTPPIKPHELYVARENLSGVVHYLRPFAMGPSPLHMDDFACPISPRAKISVFLRADGGHQVTCLYCIGLFT